MQSLPGASSSPMLRPLERLVWWLVVVASAFFLTAAQIALTAPYRLTTLAELVHFQAAEPFQHRVLAPALAALIEHIAPVGDRLAFGLIEMSCWIALVWMAERALAATGLRTEWLRRALALTVLAPLAIVTLLPDLQLWPALIPADGRIELGQWLARPLFYYPYDLPAALFTLALFVGLMRAFEAGLERRSALVWLALFALATCNRETTLFLLPILAALLWQRLTPRSAVGATAAVLALFLIIQFGLQWVFADQPNPHRGVGASQYEWHIAENWAYISRPFYSLGELVRFVGGLWIGVALWWRWMDQRLRRAVLVFTLPLVATGLIVGRVAEHRVFVEAVPLLWLALVQGITRRAAAACR